MKFELYGFEKFRKQQWYKGYNGIMLFGKRILGFSIFNNRVVVQLKPNIISKPSIGIWIYIFFYNICIEFKDPWKGTIYE
jgi:ABC-type microcin C transport system permease subunit YejB